MAPEPTAAAAAAEVAPGLLLLESGPCRNSGIMQVQHQRLATGSSRCMDLVVQALRSTAAVAHSTTMSYKLGHTVAGRHLLCARGWAAPGVGSSSEFSVRVISDNPSDTDDTSPSATLKCAVLGPAADCARADVDGSSS